MLWLSIRIILQIMMILFINICLLSFLFSCWRVIFELGPSFNQRMTLHHLLIKIYLKELHCCHSIEFIISNRLVFVEFSVVAHLLLIIVVTIISTLG